MAKTGIASRFFYWLFDARREQPFLRRLLRGGIYWNAGEVIVRVGWPLVRGELRGSTQHIGAASSNGWLPLLLAFILIGVVNTVWGGVFDYLMALTLEGIQERKTKT